MTDRNLVLVSLAAWAAFAIIVMALDWFASGSGRRPRILRFLTEDQGDAWEPATRAPDVPRWTTTVAGAAVDWRFVGGRAAVDPSLSTLPDAALDGLEVVDGVTAPLEVSRTSVDPAFDEIDEMDEIDEWGLDDGPDVVDEDGFAYDFDTEFADDPELADDSEFADDPELADDSEFAELTPLSTPLPPDESADLRPRDDTGELAPVHILDPAARLGGPGTDGGGRRRARSGDEQPVGPNRERPSCAGPLLLRADSAVVGPSRRVGPVRNATSGQPGRRR